MKETELRYTQVDRVSRESAKDVSCQVDQEPSGDQEDAQHRHRLEQ